MIFCVTLKGHNLPLGFIPFSLTEEAVDLLLKVIEGNWQKT